jgi:nucleoside-diphosphate-sugar epimerase
MNYLIIDHFFHLAAIYDLKADAESQRVANVEGTRHAMELADHLRDQGQVLPPHQLDRRGGPVPGRVPRGHVRGGRGPGRPLPAHQARFRGVVRKECPVPFRIYRPGIVVGHSKTGEIDKIDGPYYFFTLIKRMRQALPQWMPMLGIEGGRINMVPVDFVADAMDHIAHKRGLDGGASTWSTRADAHRRDAQHCSPRRPCAGDDAALDARMFAFVPPPVKGAAGRLPPVKRLTGHVPARLPHPAPGAVVL